jgi:EmrB/QacA subfamily drug resistance transporter
MDKLQLGLGFADVLPEGVMTNIRTDAHKFAYRLIIPMVGRIRSPPRSRTPLPKHHELSDDHISLQTWRIVTVATLGPFLSTLDSTVVNVSLSGLATELRTNLGVIQWVASAYLLSLALVLPLSGWMVDRIGARKLYIWCFAVFTATSVLCGAAWSPVSLIGFRILQGMTGGLLAPMAQMMIARASNPKNITKVMGYTAPPVMLGPLFGPVLAGAILQHGTWRWLFLINLPVGILAVVLSIFLLPHDHADLNPRRFDFVGFIHLSPGLVAFLYGLDHLPTTAGKVSLFLAVLLIGMFLLRANRMGSEALMNLSLFRIPTFNAAAVTQFLANAVALAGQVLIPYYLISGCHMAPKQAGWFMAPMGVGMMCTYPFMGTLAERFGIRNVSAGGAFVATIGTAPFIWMAARSASMVPLIVVLFIRGCGLGAINIPSMSAAYSAVTKAELPMATTTLNILQRLGGPIMTTLVAMLIESHFNHSARFASRPFVLAFGLLSAVQFSLIVAAWRLPMWIDHQPAQDREAELEAFEALTD